MKKISTRRYLVKKMIVSAVLFSLFTLVFFTLAAFSSPPPTILDFKKINIQVTGKVTNSTGQPIPGVTIRVKETGAGTATNLSGDYSISVAETATLVFSSIGYEDQEIAVGGRTTIDIVMVTSTKALEQVVVVGYGTQRKRDLTGAISSVSGAEIAKQPVLTATQAIQGKVAGVQIISSGSPNSAPVVRIRGTGTLLGGVNPLYVVDGVLTEDIRNINTADIVTFDVLKDASSAAIYGVRAANGVIIITTKKGRGNKMTITYDGSVGMREASHLVKMANATEYARYINQASINTGNGAVLIDSSLTKTSTDWYGTILRKAFSHNHNISLSGATDKLNYFFSAGYLNEQGIVINNKFERFTLRSNNEYKLAKVLKLNTLASYSRGVTQDVNLGAAYNNAYHAAPVLSPKINGLYGNTSAFQNVGNPLLDIESNNNKLKENRLQATAALELKPLSWITLRSSYGIEMAFNDRRVYGKAFNNDSLTFLIAGGAQKRPKSDLSITDERASRWVWDNTATVQKSFNKHDVTFLVGTTAEKAIAESNFGSRSDVPADPNLWYLNQGDPASQLNGASAEKRTRNSYLARLNYGYDRRYLLTATFRADGTSLLEKHWGYFPSIGIGWNIHREAFMAHQTIFDVLKVRASWGRLGNDNIPSSARFQTLQTGLPYYFNGTLVSGSALLDIVDKNVKWETSEGTDIGLEFSVLKGKLNGEFDWYQKKVDNALIKVPISGVLGDPDGFIITNVASIDNKGYEVTLNWKDKFRQSVNYTVSGNLSHNKNNVVGLNGGQPIFSGSVGSKGNTTLTSNDQPIGSFYLLQADGVFHNQGELAAYKASNGNMILINNQLPVLGDMRYKDINDDGKIDDEDRQFSGSYQPKFTAGLSLSVTYKAIDVAVSSYGSFGSKIYNGKKAARFNAKDNVEASVANESWTFANFSSNVPRANLNVLPHSTYFLESGNFVRLNNITIGYNFTEATLKKFGVTNFRLYITGQNLATFTKYTGFTPELAESDPLNQGIEYNAYPTTRTYAFGVNLTF